jgi:hypothetical protein
LLAAINTPTVWGSISAIGEKLDVVSESKLSSHTSIVTKQVVMEVSKEIPQEVSRLIDPFKESMVETFTERLAALEDQINTLKSFIIQSMKHLADKIDTEVSNIGWNDSGATQANITETVKPDWFLDVMMGIGGENLQRIGRTRLGHGRQQ